MNAMFAFGSKNHWRRTGCFLIATTFLCAVTGSAGHSSSEQKVTFQFNPPHGTSFVETLRHGKSLTAQVLSKPVAEIKQSKMQYDILKTDFGYSIIVKPLQPSMKVSEDISAQLTDILSSVVLSYDLDKQGKLLRVRGTKKVLDKLKKNLPPDFLDLALSFLGKNLEQVAAGAWSNKGMGMMANLVGNTCPLNKAYPPVPIELPLPLGGTMAASMRLKISGPTVCNGRHCVKILYSYESTDPNVGEKLGEAMRSLIVGFLEMTKAPEADEVAKRIPHFQISEPRSVYTLEQLADPSTGLIYLEAESKTMEALFGLAGEEKSRFTFKETKEYSYVYKK
jgi:hypothetical protein